MEHLPLYDVVIAGGGPAGCASAIILKQSGISVCLVEGDMESSRRIGESLPGATLRLLNRLGIRGIGDLLPPHDYKSCVANASAWGSEQWSYQEGMMNPEGGGWHVNRRNFNAALRRKAASLGIPVYSAHIDALKTSERSHGQNEHLICFSKKEESAPEALRAKWLIDATGRKARLARKFDLAREKPDDQMAAICWINAPSNDQDLVTRIKSVPEGWWYTALLPGNTRVISLQSLPHEVARVVKDPSLFLESFNATNILSYQPEESLIVEMRAVEAGISRLERATVEGLVCVGDAALSLDPLSSQGVFFALYSGIKAAETLTGCLQDPSSINILLDQYQQLVDKVYHANQSSRRYHYTGELRFLQSEYWQTRTGVAVNRES
jgi:flavin-dependent dehydrogenase